MSGSPTSVRRIALCPEPAPLKYRLSAGSAEGSRLIGVSGAWNGVSGEVRESLLPSAEQLPGWELELGGVPRSPGS